MKKTIKVIKLRSGALSPAYAYNGDAGMDLFSAEDISIKPQERVAIATGIAMSIPEGYAGFIWDKSGLSIGNGLKTLGGVIDSGYRGEIKVGLINHSDTAYTISKGHKIAQIIIQKNESVAIEEVGSFDDTQRWNKGFGSSGK